MPELNDTGVDALLRLRIVCRGNGVMLDDAQAERLSAYVHLLQEWNKKINLISRRDTENIWYSHLLHSLTPLFFLEIPACASVLDLGSGGGLPGIPLAIASPRLEVTLLDSIRKKTAALKGMVEELGLQTVRVVTGRAEEVALDPDFAGRFEIVIARAVAPLSDLIRWSAPLLQTSSRARVPLRTRNPGEKANVRLPCLIALKGGDLERETAQARLRFREKGIRVVDLEFAGSAELGLVDKKMVIVDHNNPISVIAK